MNDNTLRVAEAISQGVGTIPELVTTLGMGKAQVSSAVGCLRAKNALLVVRKQRHHECARYALAVPLAELMPRQEQSACALLEAWPLPI